MKDDNIIIIKARKSDKMRVLEAQFKLAPIGFAYAKINRNHCWSFPRESAESARSILATVFNLRR